MNPSVGRIVHFRESEGDEAQAALIVKVNDDSVNLLVFRDGGNDLQQGWARADEVVMWRTDVRQAGENDGYPTWNWPELQEAKDPGPSDRKAKDEEK